MGKHKAFFFDRDGVLIHDANLLVKSEDINIIESAPDFVSKIRSLGYKTVLVTNQTVVARGLLSFEKTQQLNTEILDKIKAINRDAIFDEIYICPHHPQATVEAYRLDCSCRKPRAGMLVDAAIKLNLNLTKSYMIGDRITDIVAGNIAGCKTFHFQSGEHHTKAIESNLEFTKQQSTPTFVIQNLAQALAIVSQEEDQP